MAKQQVLIVGAGSMGLVTGYYLTLAGADVTFLVRPHHAETLCRPQLLYCYDDNKLKELTGYKFLTDPSQMLDKTYDFILITLDGSALRNETGQALVKTIGAASAANPGTKVIIGSIFPELREWFISISGIPEAQVVQGALAIHAHSPAKAVFKTDPAVVDAALLAKADQAYSDKLGASFMLQDEPAEASKAFADLFSANGISPCGTRPAGQFVLMMNPAFTVFAGCELLSWPRYADIDAESDEWKLTVAAMKEVQALGLHGEAGKMAAEMTTTEAMKMTFVGIETAMMPLPLSEFYRYHHSGKVAVQDRDIRLACLEMGKNEGKEMAALSELVRKVDQK
jgi:hypothetical protein